MCGRYFYEKSKANWAIVNKNNINLFQGPVQDRTFSARQAKKVSETNLKYRK